LQRRECALVDGIIDVMIDDGVDLAFVLFQPFFEGFSLEA